MVISEEFKTAFVTFYNNTDIDQETRARRLLRLDMIHTDTETLSDNLVSWTVTSLDSYGATIRLTFRDPLKVSLGKEPDMMLVFADLSGLIDTVGISLSSFEFLQR